MTDSPLREMMNESGKCTYKPLPSLEAAQRDKNGIAVFEGDDGGEVYIVCAARLIHCSEDVLATLLQEIDEIEWPGNDPCMRRVYFESRETGLGIPGGMGGGIVTGETWIHPRLVKQGLGESIKAVLDGTNKKLK
jgi:hypothetical protein